MSVYSLFYYYGFRHQNNSYVQIGGDKAFINGVGISVHYPIRLTLHRINLGNPIQLWFIYYRFCVSVVIDLTWLYLRCTYFFPHHALPQPKKETKTLVYAVHTPFTYYQVHISRYITHSMPTTLIGGGYIIQLLQEIQRQLAKLPPSGC